MEDLEKTRHLAKRDEILPKRKVFIPIYALERNFKGLEAYHPHKNSEKQSAAAQK